MGGRDCVIESGHAWETRWTLAQATISIVAPFVPQSAIIIEHAYVSALSPHAKIPRSSDRE
jgi:hypothetical protein